MATLTKEDYIEVMETAARLAHNGLVVYRIEPGEPFPIYEWANEVVLARSQMEASELFGTETPFFMLGNNGRLAKLARERLKCADETPFEVELTAKDGSTYWIECVVRALRPASNGAFRFVCATHPIERRKEHEAFAQLLASAVDRQPEGVFIVRFSTTNLLTPTVVYINAAFTRLTGYSVGDLEAGTYPRILVGATGRATVQAQTLAVMRGESVVTELQLARKDGSRFWAEVRAHPIESPPVHGVLIINDITERRRDQEEMSLLSEAISNASDFVIVTDAIPPSEGGPSIVYVNRSFLEATGYEESHLIGRPYESIFAQHNTAPLMAAMRAAIEAGGPNYREALLARENGGDIWIEFVERPFETKFGRHLRLNIARDITLRRRASSQLSLLFSTAEKAATPIIIYEPSDDHHLTVAYENEAAAKTGHYHLLSLWSNGGAEGEQARERLSSGEEYATSYAFTQPDGRASVAYLTASVIRNESRIEAILTQERIVETSAPELGEVLPELARLRAPAQRTKALRALLRRTFDAQLTVGPAPASRGAVRIDESSRVASFALDGFAASVTWDHPLEPLALTALRLCIESAAG